MTYAISVGTSNLFFYCYFGKYATDYLAAFANCLFQSNWFMMSNQNQKPFVIMIGYAQIPCVYHGSNIANLNLELFTKVSKLNVFGFAFVFSQLLSFSLTDA